MPTLTLTVNAAGRVYLGKPLLAQLNLRAGQPIDLLPPSPTCPSWQLDIRATARRRISWCADTRPRIESVRLPPGLLPAGSRLTLTLAPAATSVPGLYPLVPVQD